MKRHFLLLPALAICFAFTSDKLTTKQIASNNNQFASELYQEIAKTNEGNIFISPFSISTALAMTYAGAAGKTAEEMSATLKFEENNENFHSNYGKYLKELEDNAAGKIELAIANRLWGDPKFKINPTFSLITEQEYRSKLEQLDFENSPDISRVAINRWVEDKTNNRIKDLIPAGAISNDTRLVLTNAIYFKADWLVEFKESKTKKGDFKTLNKEQVKASFMNAKRQIQYFENTNYKSVRLPYKGKKQSMVVVLPNNDKELTKIEKLQGSKFIQEVFQSGLPEVILSLPKFKMTLPLSLKSNLTNLGIKAAFGPANFSKMGSADGALVISDVLHKAFIEIDEKGTEAAAATAVIMIAESMSQSVPPPPKTFNADHPFLFYIVDDETQAILFMGRMADPT